MITRSTGLQRRLAREMVRHAGSLAILMFYDGTMPATCDASADGERVTSQTPLAETFLRRLADGLEPALPQGATYWRLLDNGGLVVMQGDGT